MGIHVRCGDEDEERACVLDVSYGSVHISMSVVVQLSTTQSTGPVGARRNALQDGGTPGGNILSTSSGSVKVGATGTSISGPPGVPQNAGNMGLGEVSNITAGGTVLTSTGSGSRVSTASPGSASSDSSGILKEV
ncbi:hypothetical protein HPB50_019355 [Hyalomma asiaticum]|uniref:Uncharacterized protein n=1 Tax=Hyalomma asiaticum TaxID=266040 RepID=A0ACB7SLG9_HYAAI|nr:hypothetical protein HPB50_019355 [Hyalomma asiaticum]